MNKGMLGNRWSVLRCVALSTVALSVAALAGGCASSPPLRYYTLSAVAPGYEPAPLAGSTSVPRKVGRVTIPSEIDRAQIVNRMDANRLRIAEMHRWAAPLDEMVRRTLSADLAARLPPGAIVDLNETRKEQIVLAVDIHEFYGDADCAVTLIASWRYEQVEESSARKPEEIHVPASGGCPDGLASGMSRAVAELSDRIIGK